MECRKCLTGMNEEQQLPTSPHYKKWRCPSCNYVHFQSKPGGESKRRTSKNQRMKKRHMKAGNTTCAVCGGDDTLHLDHIIPVKHGGADAFENTQLLCKKCHWAKSRDEGQFRRNNPALHKEQAS